MPRTVTALRAKGAASVDVEVDGAVWRRVPVEAAVAAGLAPGIVLDRRRLRRLRSELRRVEAVDAAARALRHRDLAASRLEHELARRGVAPRERRTTIEGLESAGLLDDRRLAHGEARRLAKRGYGDAAIRWRLEQAGLADEVVSEAVAALEREIERARKIVEAEGLSARTARMLSRRGFGEDAVESAAPVAD